MTFTPVTSPLTIDEQSRVDRVGLRIGAELRVAINDLPIASRANARVLARALGLDLALCQSVLDASRVASDGLRTMALLPGKVGTLRFVRGLERRIGRACETLEIAAEQYALTMDQLGPTQNLVMARLEETLKDPARTHDRIGQWREAREGAFRALSQVANAWSDTVLDVGILQIDATDPSLMMETSLTTQLGLRTRGFGHPISSQAWVTGKDSREVHSQDGVMREPRRPLLVREFSTYPLPIVTSRDEGGGNVSMIDISLDSKLEWVDVAQERVASRLPTPNDEDPLWSSALSSRMPTRRLVSTYFVPRAMAERSIVSAAGYFWHPGLSGDPARHWHEQLPGMMPVEHLDVGIARAGHPTVAPLHRMAEYLFGRCGVSPSDYMGFRMDVEYPIWGAVYYLTFDFRA